MLAQTDRCRLLILPVGHPALPCWCQRTIRAGTGARNNFSCDHHRRVGCCTPTSNSPPPYCCWPAPSASWTA